MQQDREKILKDFDEAVNMTPAALKKHLATQESKDVGYTHEGETESVGHAQGGKIIELLGKKKSDLSEDDLKTMRKVIGYVHRHLAQGGPEKDVEHSSWRYSLMNWGHDPLKN